MKSFLWKRFGTTVLFLGILLSIFGLQQNSFVSTQPLPFCIAIDAGHGGIDGGAVGKVTNVKESDINLAVSLELSKVLQDRGFSTFMTRTTHEGLYGLPTNGFKKRDMERRKILLQSSKPDLVVSIHMNTFSDKKRHGAQVFWQSGDTLSQIFAQTIQTELNNFQQLDLEALKGDFFILQCVDVPSVIVECGFLSNASDEQHLLDESFQTQLSQIIAKGIQQYFMQQH